jgi:hypothetical protein
VISGASVVSLQLQRSSPVALHPLMHPLIVNELWRQSKILFPVQMLLQVLHSFDELSDSSMQSGPPVI